MPARPLSGRPILRACLAAMMLAALSACGSKPVQLKISVNADGHSNPDPRGDPRPVVVRVFELKSLAGFNSADFFQIYEKEAETLGADLIGREELRLRSNESVTLIHALKPDTKFIAALAAFREPEKSIWRSAAAVPVNKKQIALTVAIQGKTISVAPAP
jgi:type VI secretion system protein VasD